MKTIPLLKTTVQRVLHQPAIIFLLIAEYLLLLFFLFGIQCEYAGDTLISISIFGSVKEIDPVMYVLLDTFLAFFLKSFVFLCILGTASLFSEFYADSLLPIVLTKGISRTRLLLAYYLYSVVTVFFLQIMFSVFLLSVTYIKLHDFYVPLAYTFTFGPTLIVAVLIALSAVVAVAFDKPMVSVAVLLVGYFVQGYLYGGFSYLSALTKVFLFSLPPLAQMEKHFLSVVQQSQVSQFPVFVFLYIFVYLGIASLLFERKDIS